LELIEKSTHKIERRLSDIAGYIRKAEGAAPQISSFPGGSELSKISFSRTLMKNAETSRPWKTIGIDQWIQAGRWWLLRVESPTTATGSFNYSLL